MSERKVDIDTTNSGATGLITEEETRAQKKARRAQVLDRGVIGARLHVDLPEHLHGEWVSRDPVEVHRKQSLGFRFEKEYSGNNALHSLGDNATHVGDVVFMVCDKEDKEILDEVRAERYLAVHGSKGGKQIEERSFTTNADSITVPTASSKVHAAKKADITSALKAATST